jgi:DNA polymerase III sliding clamp (beta) subunit (PCNA family)
MRIEISADRLAQALGAVASIARRGPMPALECVRIEYACGTVTMSTTDLDTWGTVRLEGVEGDAGVTIVNAGMLLAAVRARSGAHLVIDADAKALRIAGKGKVSLPVMHADDFPAIPVAGDGTDIDMSDIITVLREVSYCAGDDEARPNLCGVNFSPTEVCATDGHRLAMVQRGGMLPCPPEGTLVPTPLVTLLLKNFAKAGEAKAWTDGANLVIWTDWASFGGRLSAQSFPNVAAFVPTKPAPTLLVDNAEFAEAVKLVGLVKRKDNKVSLRRDGAELRLEATSDEGAYACQHIEAEGLAGVDLHLNVTYLAEALAHIPEAKITMRVEDSLSPVVLSGRDGSIHLIMPMRG